MKIKLTFIYAVLILLSGCRTIVELDQTSLAEQPINTMVVQDPTGKIQVEKSNKGAMAGGIGFGLLGAAIGSAIDASSNAKRAESLVPIQSSMTGYDMQQVFKEKLGERMSNASVGSIEVTGGETLYENLESTSLPVRVPTLLLTSTLTANMMQLFVEANMGFRQSEGEGTIYRRRFVSIHHLDKMDIKQTGKSRAAVLVENIDAFQGLLDQSLDELAVLVVDNFTGNELKKISSKSETSLSGSRLVTGSLRILKDDGDRALLASITDKSPTMVYMDTSRLRNRTPSN